VQVDPIKPILKAPVPKRLKLKTDELLSSFAFKFNLRRYNKASGNPEIFPVVMAALVSAIDKHGRGLHSSTSQLNLSRA
jgi:hypothetical protein